MSGVLALSDAPIFAIGAVVFIAVFTAGLSLAYARFAELDADDRPSERRSRDR